MSTEQKTDQSNTQQVNVLVAGTDLQFARAVQLSTHQIAAANADKTYRIMPAANKEKLLEALDKGPYHSILVEKEFCADSTPQSVLGDIKNKLQKDPQSPKTAVIFVVSSIDSAETVAAYIRMGYTDVIVKPLDNSLFLQKMNLYNPDVPFMKDDVLFSMDAAKQVSLSMGYTTKSIAEYGMKAVADRAMDVGTFMGVNASFLSEPLSAVVIGCKQVEKTYEIDLMFVGVTPPQTQLIRKFIRQEYAEEKNAA